MVAVTLHCMECKQSYEWQWQSQSTVHGKIPAILMAGASISKILLIFHHTGLCLHCKDTLQTSRFLIPKCPQVHYWQIYRSNLVKELKTLKDVAWTGDGRFDSIGHSAKYGAYTMLCTTIMKVVHFEVVQVHHHVRAKFG